MKLPKKTIGIIAGVFILGLVLWATGLLKVSVTYHTTNSTVPRDATAVRAEQAPTAENDEWLEYRSPVHGFVVWYPRGWAVDDSQTLTPSIRFVAPNDKAMLIVGVLGDERLKQPDGATTVIADIRMGFEKDKQYVLDRFERLDEDTALLAGGYLARGTFDGGKTSYRFKELGILLVDGRGFINTGNVLTDSTAQYGGIVDAMIGSFDPFGQRSKKPELKL